MSLIQDIQARLAAAQARAAAAAVEDPEEDDIEIEPEDVPADYRDEPETVEVSAAEPAEVAEYCHANGCPDLAGPLIRQNATMNQVRDRVGAAETIRAMVADAGAITETIGSTDAEAFIRAGLSVEQARMKLWDGICAAQSPEIMSSISSDSGLVTQRRQATASMDAAVAQINERFAAAHQVPQPKEG